jgi:hypothetical protein
MCNSESAGAISILRYLLAQFRPSISVLRGAKGPPLTLFPAVYASTSSPEMNLSSLFFKAALRANFYALQTMWPPGLSQLSIVQHVPSRFASTCVCLNLANAKRLTSPASPRTISPVQLDLSTRLQLSCDRLSQSLARSNFPRALNPCRRNCSASRCAPTPLEGRLP